MMCCHRCFSLAEDYAEIGSEVICRECCERQPLSEDLFEDRLLARQERIRITGTVWGPVCRVAAWQTSVENGYGCFYALEACSSEVEIICLSRAPDWAAIRQSHSPVYRAACPAHARALLASGLPDHREDYEKLEETINLIDRIEKMLEED